MWRRAVYVVVIASLCLARQPSLAAWEKDTHYGLTLWLGLQAGFSVTDAKRVAELTQGDDEGFVTPATMTESIALLIGDVSGARLTGRRHFPTSGAIPGEPANRSIAANCSAHGGRAAQSRVDRERRKLRLDSAAKVGVIESTHARSRRRHPVVHQ